MWWRLDEEAMLTKRLYKELSSELDQSIDNEKLYNFAFMSEKDLEKDLQKHPEHFWFKVGDITGFSDLSSVTKFIIDNNLTNNMNSIAYLVSSI